MRKVTKKKAPHMTLEQADAHQRRHGFKPLLQKAVDETVAKMKRASHLKKKKLKGEPPKMNQTEREFSMILESQRVRGDIVRAVFQGITLLWGGNMRYKADFFVVVSFGVFRCVEVKGAQIWDRDIVRFKGCRAAWPEFEFEMWQKKEGRWNQLL